MAKKYKYKMLHKYSEAIEAEINKLSEKGWEMIKPPEFMPTPFIGWVAWFRKEMSLGGTEKDG